MAESPHLGLPFLEAGQAQKHVTHNEALRILDALVQLSVKEISASPPGSPDEGERHIVAAGASGAFASKDHKVAVYEDGAWRFLTPHTGWRAWSEEDEVLFLWNGAAWTALESGGGGGGFDPDDVDHIYLNDAAPGDAEVKFAMRGETALLHAIPSAESGNGDVQLQISKETSSDTASVFFSTNFSGRAEFGLTGSDNFKLKVSPNGSSWTEALDIDKSTGRVRLPAVLALTDPAQAVARRDIREMLSTNRTYYVRTDGSNSNDGLANTSGGAFLTIQKAWDTIITLDLNGYSATVQIADGTYTAGLTISMPPLGGLATIQGNNSTPANVVISTTSADCFKLDTAVPGFLTIKDLKVQTTTSGTGIHASAPGAYIKFQNVNFGACASHHLWSSGAGSKIIATGNYSITGSANAHARTQTAAAIEILNVNGVSTVTFTGTIAWGQAFAWCIGGAALFESFTFSGGTITGTRWMVHFFGVVYATMILPGNADGAAVSGTINTTGGGMKA